MNLKPLKTLKSFVPAFNGFKLAFKEANMSVHILAAISVIIAGFLFRISAGEWAILSIAIGIVIALEIVNSAIEDLANTLRDSLNLSYEATKEARDLAAAAVLVVAIAAGSAGLLVFIPRLIQILQGYNFS